MAVKSKIIYNLSSGFKLIRNCGKPILSLTACVLTARQYGEVVLPDAASGQSPGTLAAKLSRCKEGMACFLPSWYKFY